MNTARKRIVEQANDAFAKGNIEGFLNLCVDDMEWTMVGETTISGKDNIRNWMKSMGGNTPPNFSVDHIVADDEYAFVEGDMRMKDKDGRESLYTYCDVYRFRGDRIAALKAFVIKTDRQPAPQAG